MKSHKWTEEDEQRLIKAIEECMPLMEHYTNQGYSKKNWWDAVAGKLLPDVIVTGAACARYFQRIKERDQATKDEAWDRVANQMLDYERDLQEATYDKVVKLEVVIRKLCEAWGIECEK